MAEQFDPFQHPDKLWDMARFKSLEHLSQVYEGRQYDGRPDWWTGKCHDGDEPRPILERKPCVIYRLPKAATEQVVKFLFGEGRFPSVSAAERAEEETDGFLLGEEEAKVATGWLSAATKSLNLHSVSTAVAGRAIAIGAHVLLLRVAEGRIWYETQEPQHCWAEFEGDDPALPVKRLLICFQFDKEVLDGDRLVCKRHVFRQEWDAANVYSWDDVEIAPGKKLEWGSATTTPHGLSFCPVLWVRNEATTTGIDGRSLFDDLEEEFHALDVTLSRRHQGIVYLGTPQLVETSEEFESVPEETGGKTTGTPGYSAPQTHGAHAGRARKAGPGIAWRYEGKDVHVELIETTGKAFEVGTLHVNDIRSRILETMGVVLTNMQDTMSNRVSLGAEMSARFLALAHAPLITLVEQYRVAWWEHYLKPLLSMTCRALVDMDKAGMKLPRIRGTDKALPVLQGCYGSGGQWELFEIDPSWGDFFTPSSTEIKTDVDAAKGAVEARLISPRTGTEFVAHQFDVDDLESELEAIAEQAEQDRQIQEDQDRAAIEKLHEGLGGTEAEGAAAKRSGGSGSASAVAAKDSAGETGRSAGSSADRGSAKD